MLETFKATLSPMLVMFLCILIGFIAQKKSITPDNTAAVFAKFENYVFVPALIINTFMRYCTVRSIAEQYELIVYAALALVLALCIALPLSRAFVKNDVYKRNIYKYALTFGNFSFMGNAIVPAIFGEEMLYPYMLFTLPLNVAVYTWGVLILVPQGQHKDSIFKRMFNTTFLSILVGAGLGLTGAARHVPKFVSSTISSCAACMGPLAMILTGFVIGGYDFGSLLKKKSVYVATALRLLIFPAVFIVVLRLLGADNTVLVCALFAFATPLGLNTVVFPAAYGGDTSIGASMAMISHTFCVLTIPLMYALLTCFI